MDEGRSLDRLCHVLTLLYCRQVIRQLRTYSSQETLLNVDVEGKVQQRNCDQKSIVLGEVYRMELGKVQQRHIDRKSIITLFNSSDTCTLLPNFFPNRKVSFVHFSKVSQRAILQPIYTNQRTNTEH